MHEPLNLPQLRKEQRRVAALMQSQQTVRHSHRVKRHPLNVDYLYWCSHIDPDGHHRNPALDHLKHGLRAVRGEHPCDFFPNNSHECKNNDKNNPDGVFGTKKKKVKESKKIAPEESLVLPGLDFSEDYDYDAWRRRTAKGRHLVQSLDSTLDDPDLRKNGQPLGQSLDSALDQRVVKLPSISKTNKVTTQVNPKRENGQQTSVSNSNKIGQSSQVTSVSAENSLSNISMTEPSNTTSSRANSKKKPGKVQFGVKSEYFYTDGDSQKLEPHVSRLDSQTSLITQVQAANEKPVIRNDTPPRLLYTHIKEKQGRDRLASMMSQSRGSSGAGWCECGEEYRKGQGGLCKNCGKKRRKSKKKDEEKLDNMSDLQSGQLLYNRYGIEDTPPVVSPDIEKFLLKSILKDKNSERQKKEKRESINDDSNTVTFENNIEEEVEEEQEIANGETVVESNNKPIGETLAHEGEDLSQQSSEDLLPLTDIHRDAYLAALNEARFRVLPEEPWMLGTNVSRAFVFSYFKHIPENCECEKCSNARLAKTGGARNNQKKVVPVSKKRAIKSKTSEMTSIFGDVKISEHYPGGSKGWRQYNIPVKRSRKKLETVISSVQNLDA
ncbi:uncharacterized protein LOC106170153 isoform X2 [Lingula anatina]|nr:uncharacterized protein LOC106170153 isoform X2 [Lingula anatina]XP_013405356.1 uncharacterized protein LOC106170153 isoform X2 [Lingula anatina]XP_013405358.1 uncharacterized protein LOC106170153 isoform X2 [Lingula anatina]XP_013405359.1 uncharacterized protein LOC106170153 isoform X2 [Lingula anatina]|eukprot:XP_013405355.1 uncharacterized protein LOC106170153 isoform X2 [Lingula anatina]